VVQVSGYWRPASLEEALVLLERPGRVVIGGGTKVNAQTTAEPIAVVDLQALGLHDIGRIDGDVLRIGATVTLQQLVECGEVPAVIREAARREQPSTLRAQATIGGSIVTADPESELLATLLVHDAVVSLVGAAGPEELTLEGLLAELPFLAGRIVTDVVIDAAGSSYVTRAGRTRADRAIVAAAARVRPDGKQRVALSGVARTPILIDATDELEPPGDFRGSSEYRRALAEILVARALEALS
jgi:probable selenate reductase FAD-binding subunit